MKQKTGITFAGILLLLIAPLLGTNLADFYLRMTDGMETEKFMCILEGCIFSIQMIGILITAYGLFGQKNTATI